jgi:hypothetical protein
MFGFGRKKSEKSPAQMSAFERRQSMAAKFELEERKRTESYGLPPPPPAATELAFDSPSNKKKGSVRVGGGNSTMPPPPLIDRKPADSEYIEFTIVPILLRAKVAYDEANKYGDSLKRMTEAEVKIIMANATNLIDDVKKCGIKAPPTFEKDIVDDMFWKAGSVGNRKSFVYYKASDTQPAEGGRPKSDSHSPVQQVKEQSRQRASFSGPALPVLEETDPNRYKVKSRTKAAESLSQDLADLVSSLDKISTGKKQ